VHPEFAGGKVPYTILVVEDNLTVLNLVADILRKGGCGNMVDGEDCGAPHRLPDYEVLTAVTAEAGLVIGVEHPGEIHLLITDVVMEGMRGDELARRLKAPRPQMQVMLMSGYSEGDLKILKNGWQFLQKPFLAAALLDLVRSALGIHAGAAR
jgi:CheY-like chemotaxis protein